jgi:toxin ParE1/3/4
MILRRTTRAVEDLENCIFWSATHFGLSAAHRYKKLLEVSLLAIVNDAALSGSKPIEGFQCNVRIYHIRHSRKNAEVSGKIVKNPRHFIVYQKVDDQTIDILRVLHDSMDLEGNLNH